MADAYIDFHLGNVEDIEISKETREALCEKRLSEGWFLYALLELKTRYLIPGPLQAKVDDSLELYNDIINKTFSMRWGSHKCNKPGCGNVLVFDGGVKAHRKICAAIKSEVKIYYPSGIQVTTGCTRHPAPGQQFCSVHHNYESPVLLPSQVSKTSLEELNRQQKLRNNLETDKLFVVEGITEIKLDDVLVKWEGYKNPTWEPMSNMPSFIRKFVSSHGCGKVPDPIIKHEKVIDGNKHVMLEWTTDAGDKDVLWHAVEKTDEEEVFKCDTKKDKDTRLCRHSFGINIACWPCGVVVMFKVCRIYYIDSIIFYMSYRNCLGQKVPPKCMHKSQNGCHLLRRRT